MCPFQLFSQKDITDLEMMVYMLRKKVNLESAASDKIKENLTYFPLIPAYEVWKATPELCDGSLSLCVHDPGIISICDCSILERGVHLHKDWFSVAVLTAQSYPAFHHQFNHANEVCTTFCIGVSP